MRRRDLIKLLGGAMPRVPCVGAQEPMRRVGALMGRLTEIRNIVRGPMPWLKVMPLSVGQTNTTRSSIFAGVAAILIEREPWPKNWSNTDRTYFSRRPLASPGSNR
jgi:hypothetical protein